MRVLGAPATEVLGPQGSRGGLGLTIFSPSSWYVRMCKYTHTHIGGGEGGGWSTLHHICVTGGSWMEAFLT